MIDNHSHYAEAGAEDLYLIKLDDATSIPDIVARVKARVAVAKPGAYVLGRGWDQCKPAERRYIYASDLDVGNTGYPTMDPEVYRQMVRLFHQAGISVGTHAIGDRAVDWVVDTYALVEKERPIPGLRHSIIHANFPTPHAVDVMAELEKQYDAGYLEVQPVFLWWFGQSWLPTLGADRLGLVFPLKTYSDRGIRWTSGTDYGVAPLAPRYGLWAAVEREALDGKHPFDATLGVDIHTALRSYTAAAVPQLFLEKQIGSLEPSKRADIAVWDRNPDSIPSADLKNLKCEMTILDGKSVYSRLSRAQYISPVQRSARQ